jgi:hypothetical protein
VVTHNAPRERSGMVPNTVSEAFSPPVCPLKCCSCRTVDCADKQSVPCALVLLCIGRVTQAKGDQPHVLGTEKLMNAHKLVAEH